MKTAKAKKLTRIKLMSFIFFILAVSCLILGFTSPIAYFKGNEEGFYFISGLFACMGIYTFRNS